MSIHNKSQELCEFVDLFERIARELVRATEKDEKPEHLIVNVRRCAPQAMRVLIDAINAGAFLRAPSVQTLVGPLCLSKGQLIPIEKLSDDALHFAWRTLAIGWLRNERPRGFKSEAGRFDFPKDKRNAEGRLIGKDGNPLPVVEYPDPKTGCRGIKLDGEPANETDDYDRSDTMAFLRAKARDWADACLVAAQLIRERITELADPMVSRCAQEKLPPTGAYPVVAFDEDGTEIPAEMPSEIPGGVSVIGLHMKENTADPPDQVTQEKQLPSPPGDSAGAGAWGRWVLEFCEQFVAQWREFEERSLVVSPYDEVGDYREHPPKALAPGAAGSLRDAADALVRFEVDLPFRPISAGCRLARILRETRAAILRREYRDVDCDVIEGWCHNLGDAIALSRATSAQATNKEHPIADGSASAPELTESSEQKASGTPAVTDSVANSVQDEKDNKDKQDLPVLSDDAALVYEILLDLKPHRALTVPQILKALDNKGRSLDESTLRGRILPALEPYGIERKPRIGYRIPPRRR